MDRFALICLCFVAALWASASSALALDACGASPDGKHLVVGGANRAIYLYDTESWEMLEKVRVDYRVQGIHFDSTGDQCVVNGGGRDLLVYDVENWKQVKKIKGAIACAIAPKAPVAGTIRKKRGGGWKDRVLIVWSLPEWEVKKKIDLPEDFKPMQTVFSEDAKICYLRSGRFRNKKEKEADAGPKPESHMERNLWRQRTDGYVSKIMAMDVEAEKIMKTIECFDTPNKFDIFPAENGAVFACYGRYVATFDVEKGTYETKPTGEFAYGSGMGPAGNIWTGSLRSYLVLSPDSKKLGQGKIDQLPGFPEYFRDFTPLGDDKVVAVTDAWRIVIFDAQKYEVLKTIPCY